MIDLINLSFPFERLLDGAQLIEEGERCNLLVNKGIYFLQYRDSTHIFNPTIDKDEVYKLWIEINHN